MRFYNSIYEAGVVPKDWKPVPGYTLKVPVTNRSLLTALRQELPGRWRKVYRRSASGIDVHCFEHESGKVFDVKIKITQEW